MSDAAILQPLKMIEIVGPRIHCVLDVGNDVLDLVRRQPVSKRRHPPATVSDQLLRLIHGLRGIAFKILCQRRTMPVLAGFERMADKAVIVKYHRTIPCRRSAATEAQKHRE